ncbi:hypothetical protein LDENG_00044940 [Lucifuga dentata]|nr:hypothetical protein LDENG_00044940 [Lucifuga dentata]
MRCICEEEMKFLKEWHRGKSWHSEKMNDNQEERTFKDGGLQTSGRMGGPVSWISMKPRLPLQPGHFCHIVGRMV